MPDMHRLWLILSIAAVSLSASPAAFAGAPLYDITVLDMLPNAVYPNDGFLNDLGQAGGADWMPGSPFGPSHAWYWESGTTTDVHAWGGWPSAEHSWVADLNESGLMVGTYWSGGLGVAFQPATFSGGSAALLPLLTDPDVRGGEALGVNASGQIAGYCDVDFVDRPALWTSGAIADLGIPAPYDEGQAMAVNDSGIAAGWVTQWGPGGVSRAFVWDGGYTILPDLAGGSGSFAYDINGLGDICGHAGSASGYNTAVIWSGGVATDLGGPTGYQSDGGSAVALNDLGQAVGYSEVYYDGDWGQLACLWDPVLGARLLNDLIDPASGWSVHHAYDINNSGQIIAGVSDAEYNTRTVILNPTGAEVPEPGTLALVGLGLTGIFFKLRRRR